MVKFINIILFLSLGFSILTACSSVSDAKAEWYIKDVSMEKREWRYCSEDKDGPDLDGKGFCYISQKCIKKFLRKEKCVPVPMFCAHGDSECLRKNKFPAIKRGY